MNVFLPVLCVYAFVTNAQVQKPESEHLNGVYLTLEDYVHHHLTHSFLNQTKGYHLRLPNRSRLKLKTPDSTYIYDLTKIFGYCEDGASWCYRSGELVEIMGYTSVGYISYEGLWLYRRHDWSESRNGYTYFFSKNSTGELVWFTRKKIKEAYKEDNAFLNLLSKVRWGQLLYNSHKTRQPLVLEVYATSHQLDYSRME
ncbi:hypothetical protein [Runella sp.]|uniref:hypothetical protein n=1 Tax=Runella sp. TaxID=1960881 RepID=UPI003D13E1CC